MELTERARELAVVPRLLGFYRDAVLEGEDLASAYQTIAWGIRWFEGSVVTVEGAPDRPPAVTVWPDLDQAVTSLDAYVCGFAPQRALRDYPSGDGER
jgi:hypothetical protein